MKGVFCVSLSHMLFYYFEELERLKQSSMGCVNLYGITRQILNVWCHPDHCNHFASFLLTMFYVSYHPTPTFTVLLVCLSPVHTNKPLPKSLLHHPRHLYNQLGVSPNLSSISHFTTASFKAVFSIHEVTAFNGFLNLIFLHSAGKWQGLGNAFNPSTELMDYFLF